MNNLTKIDLCHIGDALLYSLSNPDRLLESRKDILIEISEKIKTMIDNYCDHEKVVPHWGPSTECAKCGEIW